MGRQVTWLCLGLVLLALGAQGVIRLVVSHDPGALRHLPGGFVVRLAVYAVVCLLGFRLVRRHRISPDPERDR